MKISLIVKGFVDETNFHPFAYRNNEYYGYELVEEKEFDRAFDRGRIAMRLSEIRRRGRVKRPTQERGGEGKFFVEDRKREQRFFVVRLFLFVPFYPLNHPRS